MPRERAVPVESVEPAPSSEELRAEAARRLVDAASGAAARAATAAQDALDEGLDAALELATVSLPRLARRVFYTIFGVAAFALGLGLVALFNRPLFELYAVPIAGILLVALGVGLFVLGLRLYDATATLRALVALARRWRARRERRARERSEP
ncbi:MAG TPA: hypothetical protein VM889_02155 [Candidatus Thermoplasmatota archaeon]|nr:hypothetical protein [Candidatus Thermoplasmatota archaeon]